MFHICELVKLVSCTSSIKYKLIYERCQRLRSIIHWDGEMWILGEKHVNRSYRLLPWWSEAMVGAGEGQLTKLYSKKGTFFILSMKLTELIFNNFHKNGLLGKTLKLWVLNKKVIFGNMPHSPSPCKPRLSLWNPSYQYELCWN